MNRSFTLAERVAEANERLTPTERRVAALVLGDSTVLAFGTVAEVADRASTSGPTIVRFAAKLGFGSYGALQQEARRFLSEQLKRPGDRIRQQPGGDTWARTRADAIGGLEAAFEAVNADTVRRMADPIVSTGRRVWIVASESSAAARVLAGGLRLLRPGVCHLAGSRHRIAACLTEASPGDVVVVIDFFRYERSVLRTIDVLLDIGTTIVAITDGAFSPLAAAAEVWCGIDVPAVGPFDSALPAVAVVEALLAEVAGRSPAEALSRIDRVEALWSAEQVFHDADPVA